MPNFKVTYITKKIRENKNLGTDEGTNDSTTFKYIQIKSILSGLRQIQEARTLKQFERLTGNGTVKWFSALCQVS